MLIATTVYRSRGTKKIFKIALHFVSVLDILSQVGRWSVSLTQTQQAVLPAGAPGHSYESSVLCCQFVCIYLSWDFAEFGFQQHTFESACSTSYIFINLKHEAVKMSKMGNLES